MINKRKRKTTRAKKQKVEERPVKQEATKSARKAISERNRVALAFMELAGDVIFQKLPEEKKLELVHEVLSIGDEVASWVIAENGTSDPRKIAARLGGRIFGADEGKGSFGRKYPWNRP